MEGSRLSSIAKQTACWFRWPALFAALALVALGVGGARQAVAATASSVAANHSSAKQSADASQEKGSVDHVIVHGSSLVGNLEGDSPDRDVYIYLPPSYRTDSARRYPVVYVLHGFTDSASSWFGGKKGWINLQQILDRDISSGAAREMIVVMPNAYTRLEGSFYTHSVVTGDWENFVVHDLVNYIDSHYRTLANRDSRGLAGHSMGGYGTVRLGMTHPEIFSSFYAMSACCLAPAPETAGLASLAASIDAVHTPQEFEAASFGTRANMAIAAAFSPDPSNPPFYFDFPATPAGVVRAPIAAKWAANQPVNFLDQNVQKLRSLRAIAFDVGTRDPLIVQSQMLDAAMNVYKIPHTFETYDGTHVSGIAMRLETKVFPYFSRHLAFGEPEP